MTTVTIDLPPAILERLRIEAARLDMPVEALISEWLVERPPARPSRSKRCRRFWRVPAVSH